VNSPIPSLKATSISGLPASFVLAQGKARRGRTQGAGRRRKKSRGFGGTVEA
jgi:hypothetical protein